MRILADTNRSYHEDDALNIESKSFSNTAPECAKGSAGESREKSSSGVSHITEGVYGGLKSGVIGKIMTSYKAPSSKKKDTRINRIVYRIFGFLSKLINSSFIVSGAPSLVRKLLSAKLRVYGTFLATYGIYTTLFWLARNFLLTDDNKVYEVFFGVGLIILSLPLLFSGATLSSALRTTDFGAVVKSVTGIPLESMKTEETYGRLNYSFILGVIAGVLSFAIGPFKIAAFLCLLAAVWIIASRPEFGVVAVSFLLPFASIGLLVFILAVTAFFFFVKIVRRKRYMKGELLDITVFVLIVSIFFGGAVSVSPRSFGASVLYCALLASYFLTVNLIKSRAWLERMTTALTTGVSLASGILLLCRIGDGTIGGVSKAASGLFGSGMLTKALDSGYAGELSLLAVMLLSVSVSSFLKPQAEKSRLHMIAGVVLTAYLTFADGVGAHTVAALIGFIMVFIVYSKKTLYAFFLLVGVAIVSSFFFPGLFSTIGGYTDSAIQGISKTGASVWKGVISLISDNFAAGVGFGKDAFAAAYPSYAVAGTESAPHASSLYLEIWAELGIVGLILLFVFFFMFVACVFTLLSRLDSAIAHPALHHSGVRAYKPESIEELRHLPKGAGASKNFSRAQFRLSGRIGAAAPFCGIVAIAVCGMFDHVWYDEGVFLGFWLTVSLSASWVRTIREETEDIISSYRDCKDPCVDAEIDIV